MNKCIAKEMAKALIDGTGGCIMVVGGFVLVFGIPVLIFLGITELAEYLFGDMIRELAGLAILGSLLLAGLIFAIRDWYMNAKNKCDK